MKIKTLKLANAIQVGSHSETFLEDSKYDMTILNNVVIKVVSKRDGSSCFTSLYNTIWFTAEEAPKKGKKQSEEQKDQ